MATAVLVSVPDKKDQLRFIAKMSKKKERQVSLKREHHFVCTTCAKEDRATPICGVVHHPVAVCACQGILVLQQDPEGILGPTEYIYMQELHNVDAGVTELVNFEWFQLYVQHQTCAACGAELGFRYLQSNHNGEEVLMDLANCCLSMSPWLPTEANPLPPQFFLIERSMVCVAHLRIVAQGEGGGGEM